MSDFVAFNYYCDNYIILLLGYYNYYFFLIKINHYN